MNQRDNKRFRLYIDFQIRFNHIHFLADSFSSISFFKLAYTKLSFQSTVAFLYSLADYAEF